MTDLDAPLLRLEVQVLAALELLRTRISPLAGRDPATEVVRKHLEAALVEVAALRRGAASRGNAGGGAGP